jgi:YfiH family protein
MRVVRFENLSQYPALVHGIATSSFGNMSFNWGEYEEVRANRQRFFDALSVPANQVVVASLVHGTTVRDVSEADRGSGIAKPEESLEADILVTNKPDTFLFMVVADCLALFLFEPDKQVCALAHAGWRGVDQQVPKITINHMVKQCGCDPAKIRVAFSPARQAVSSRFPTKDVTQRQLPGWEPYLKEVGDQTEVDFIGYAYDQFLASGVSPDHIERSPIDTRTSSDFFSHRRSVEDHEPEARFGCLIGFRA